MLIEIWTNFADSWVDVFLHKSMRCHLCLYGLRRLLPGTSVTRVIQKYTEIQRRLFIIWHRDPFCLLSRSRATNLQVSLYDSKLSTSLPDYTMRTHSPPSHTGESCTADHDQAWVRNKMMLTAASLLSSHLEDQWIHCMLHKKRIMKKWVMALIFCFCFFLLLLLLPLKLLWRYVCATIIPIGNESAAQQ